MGNFILLLYMQLGEIIEGRYFLAFIIEVHVGVIILENLSEVFIEAFEQGLLSYIVLSSKYAC